MPGAILTACFFATWIVLAVVFVVLAPMVALISYLNIKFTRFCSKCGATIIDHNWFSSTRFCSKWGAELTSTKPRDLNEL
jgi:hypothetical protein